METRERSVLGRMSGLMSTGSKKKIWGSASIRQLARSRMGAAEQTKVAEPEKPSGSPWLERFQKTLREEKEAAGAPAPKPATPAKKRVLQNVSEKTGFDPKRYAEGAEELSDVAWESYAETLGDRVLVVVPATED